MVPLHKSRKLFIEDVNINIIPVRRKKNEPFTFPVFADTMNENVFSRCYFLCMYLSRIFSIKRFRFSKDERFKPGQQIQNVVIHTTVETYLPPINANVIDYGAIQKYLQ